VRVDGAAPRTASHTSLFHTSVDTYTYTQIGREAHAHGLGASVDGYCEWKRSGFRHVGVVIVAAAAVGCHR
jgi:hypothetical protein